MAPGTMTYLNNSGIFGNIPMVEPTIFDMSSVGVLLGMEGQEQTSEEYGPPEGLAMGFIGRRRKGKSLSMVALSWMFNRYFKLPVLTNYGCDFAHGIHFEDPAKAMRFPGLATGRFSIPEILQWPEELENCVICCDEADRPFPSTRATTLMTEMFVNGLMMLGKRNIYFMWCCQNVRRIDGNLFFQTDVLIECDSWDYGRNVRWTMTDLHGAWAEPGTQRHKTFRNTERFKQMYNTREMFDPMERLTVKIKR